MKRVMKEDLFMAEQILLNIEQALDQLEKYAPDCSDVQNPIMRIRNQICLIEADIARHNQ